MGIARYFLGVELTYVVDGLYLHHHEYICDFLHDVGLLGAHLTTTPFPKGHRFTTNSGSLLTDLALYCHLIGQLLYLNFSRPDITYGVQQLSQFVGNPRQPHWEAALHILCYLKDFSSKSLFFPWNNSLSLTTHSNVDWTVCPDSRRSLTGFCILLGSSLISWKTKI